jgi:predicted nucleic acid-binding protein
MTVFVDTNAFVAIALGHDNRHQQAVRTWKNLELERAPLLTTDWVFGETVTFVRRRAGYLVARSLGEHLRSSDVLEILHADEPMVGQAWNLFLAHRFEGLSLVDCVSFVTMRVRRIRRAFTFDAHFSEAGFERLP